MSGDGSELAVGDSDGPDDEPAQAAKAKPRSIS